jgi:chromosome segregation ATPase
VRRQYVGLNQRTRLVRASDLAALTPIIDPAGAISTERGRLDLTSIPLQQAQITASQKEIKAQIEDVQRKSAAEIEVLRDLLATQKVQQEKDLTTVQAELAQELLRQSEAFIQHRQAIQALLTTQEAETRGKITDIETRIVSSLEALEQRIVAVSQQADYYVNSSQQAIQQQQQSIAGLAAILEYQAQVQEQLEQRILQLTASLEEQQKQHQAELLLLEQLSQQSAQQLASLTEQVHQHEIDRQQLTLYINKQQEHITSLEDRLEQLHDYYVKSRSVKPKHPYQ